MQEPGEAGWVNPMSDQIGCPLACFHGALSLAELSMPDLLEAISEALWHHLLVGFCRIDTPRVCKRRAVWSVGHFTIQV